MSRRPLSYCSGCLYVRQRCTCVYFHALYPRTPFLLPSRIDHARTAEQIASAPHPADGAVA